MNTEVRIGDFVEFNPDKMIGSTLLREIHFYTEEKFLVITIETIPNPNPYASRKALGVTDKSPSDMNNWINLAYVNKIQNW